MNLQTVKPRARWSPSPHGNRPDSWRVRFPDSHIHFVAGTLDKAVEMAYRLRLVRLIGRRDA